MKPVSDGVRERVRARARYRCEYCCVPEQAFEALFHIEHIIAKKHGGGDGMDNLALACGRCNLFKGPNLSGVDPASGEIVQLFHPRREAWGTTFRFEEAVIVGPTPTGSATVEVLRMNLPRRVGVRRELMRLGTW